MARPPTGTRHHEGPPRDEYAEEPENVCRLPPQPYRLSVTYTPGYTPDSHPTQFTGCRTTPKVNFESWSVVVSTGTSKTDNHWRKSTFTIYSPVRHSNRMGSIIATPLKRSTHTTTPSYTLPSSPLALPLWNVPKETLNITLSGAGCGRSMPSLTWLGPEQLGRQGNVAKQAYICRPARHSRTDTSGPLATLQPPHVLSQCATLE